MLPKIILLFGILAVCFFSAPAQKVIESESQLVVQPNSAEISLAIENPGPSLNTNARLELLDVDGKVRAEISVPLQLKSGKENYPVSLPLGDLVKTVGNDIVWYRLRYRIGSAKDVISLSQMIRDNFELRVIASENIFAGLNFRARVLAVNPFSGRPIGGVDLDVELSLELKGDDGKILKLNSNGMTDAEGFAVVEFQIPLETEFDNDGKIKVVGRKNALVREAEEDLKNIANDSQFLLLTDKPLYQPGQTLNVRGILFKGAETRTAASGIDLTFTIEDGDDTPLYRETVKTSEFGIAAISWQIPENAKLGNYRINVKNLDDDEITSQKIKVSRYDLPNFTVTAAPDKAYYLPNEKTAVIEVTADYLFGKPVTKGKVRIVRENDREWDWKTQKYKINEGESHSGDTDQAGKFTASFDLSEAHEDIEDDSWRKFDDVHFAAYFTDLTTNRTEQRRFDVRVTREPIHVYFIGQTYRSNPSLPINAYVSTFYADGTPAACDVEIAGSEEDKDKFKRLQRIKTNAFGAGKLNFKRPAFEDEDSDLELNIVATDADGKKGTSSEDIHFDDNNALQIEADRTIYRPGETVNVTVTSTQKTGKVYLDVVQGWSVIDSFVTSMTEGTAQFKVPYQPTFKGSLKIAAYLEAKDDDDLIHTARGIIFPSPQNLKLGANFNKAVYKPGEDAAINFDIWEPDGKPAESALGVVVFDKAVEERARTEGEFNGKFSGMSGWIGYGNNFGAINIKDINELDLSQPISRDLQLVAEVLLYDNYYYPTIFYSKGRDANASSVYSEYFKRQFTPVEKELRSYYTGHEYAHPADEQSLRQILAVCEIDLDELRDPWGQNYRPKFTVVRTKDILQFISAGADKTFDTDDDFIASSSDFVYFIPEGKNIDRALGDFHARTGGYIFNEKDLYRELGVSEILDHFGHAYRVIFEVSGRYYKITLRSMGPDGISSKPGWGDDFDVWSARTDYFTETEVKIGAALEKASPFPENEGQLKTALKARNLDLKNIRDGYGQPAYAQWLRFSRFNNKYAIETVSKYGDRDSTPKTIVTPVTQQVLRLTLRSKGPDGKPGNADDFTLVQYEHIISEQTKDDAKPQTPFRKINYLIGTGAISGVVTDANGAVVPNAPVIAANANGGERSTNTDDNGRFLIANLPAGTYSITVTSAGFTTYRMTDIDVRADSTINVNVVLSPGAVSATVDVSSSGDVTMNTTNVSSATVEGRREATSKNGNSGENENGIGPRSTPRLREYFPETLLWSPELITDKNGKAELKFKLADNITTWKVYTIASTKQGKLGVAEKEIKVFQPFFVDLEPPKFLTEGDEIHLPVTVRNYTSDKQRVSVSMSKGDWFNFLSQPEQQIDVSSNSAKNAVFGFKATAVIKDGKQRVTAIAQKDSPESDAVEKPVTVKPDGREIVKTESKFSPGETGFDIDFPTNALPRTQKAEVKIYTNLMAHVSESVEGLLKRPYGCGEQTISSTYPNLMILKFSKGESKIKRTAQKYLRSGYERLLGYQVASGGFSYWGAKDSPDVALTAYAVRFLSDARDYITVDEDVIARAGAWLVSQQRVDGSWTKKYYNEDTEDPARTKLFTAYVARALAMSKSKNEAALQKALGYLKTRVAEIDEPYSMALLGLASFDAGDLETARAMAARLEKMAIAEGAASYWNLESNTPFYGWGAAGRLETTALVLQLLTKVKGEGSSELLSRGMTFLLANKDRYGVWCSTQTTVNVLDAFLATLKTDGAGPGQPETIRVLLNGVEVQNVAIAADRIEPVVVDLSDKLTAANDRLEVKTSSKFPLVSQVVSSHYVDWKNSENADTNVTKSRALRLAYTCDKQSAAVMQEINCSAEAERIGFKGYGMLLAEIGIPPGAEVSRESLEKAMEADWSLSSYDILPDRIVVYMWAKAGGTKLNFSFRPRYGINAQTPASIVYDYYNPEAQAVISPLRFVVK